LMKHDFDIPMWLKSQFKWISIYLACNFTKWICFFILKCIKNKFLKWFLTLNKVLILNYSKFEICFLNSNQVE
jgi:hypothetical protein